MARTVPCRWLYLVRLVMGNVDACDGGEGEERRGEEKAREVFFPPNTIDWGRGAT